MQQPKFKIGDFLIRKEDLCPDVFIMRKYKKGARIRIDRITAKLYYYTYIDLDCKGNADFEEIESNCVYAGKLGSILYA